MCMSGLPPFCSGLTRWRARWARGSGSQILRNSFPAAPAFTIARTVRLQASMDIFNLMNSSTALSQRRNQNATNANQISSILAPRVMRFGVRMTF